MDLTPALNQFLSVVLAALASLFVALISYATFRVSQWIEAKKKESQWSTLLDLGASVIQAIEQSALKGTLEDTAKAKKDAAIALFQALADAHGIKVDLATIDTIIESLILQGIHQGIDGTVVKTETTVTSPGTATVATTNG